MKVAQSFPAKSIAKSAVVAGLLLAAVGCKGTLLVKDQGGKDDLPGVRVTRPLMVREHILFTEHSDGGKCTPAPSYRYASIPSDEYYFLNVDPAEFSKTQFTVKLTEEGYLQELAFNSEPSADAITAATGALTSLLPFAGVLPSQRTAPSTRTAAERRGAEGLCDSAPRFVCFESLDPKAAGADCPPATT